jgi:hypothetical protein
MRELGFLAGEWKGQGWLYRVEGPGSEISQSTKVTVESDGAVLRIKEKKSYKDAGLMGTPMRIPESTVTYDDEAKVYRWRVDAAKGRGNPFEANLVGPRTFQLIVHTPAGMGRTTIKVTEDGQWLQTVELLLAEGWFKLQETTLKKVK